MKLIVDTRFIIGDTVWEVFQDDDIGAWNVCDWVVNKIVVGPKPNVESKNQVSYIANDSLDMVVEDCDDLYVTSLAAANEAKERNKNER